jgi:hypothetical protein
MIKFKIKNSSGLILNIERRPRVIENSYCKSQIKFAIFNCGLIKI